MNKTYSEEAWAAVLELYVQEALSEEKIQMFIKNNIIFATLYVYMLSRYLNKLNRCELKEHKVTMFPSLMLGTQLSINKSKYTR